MATLLDALSLENLDNQREVVKNEKRWSYDNRPYGSFQEKLQAHLFPPEHPYHHSTIGSMDDLDAATVEDVSAFFRTYYAPNNAVLSVVGDVETPDVLAAAERYFGAIPPNPDIPRLGDGSPGRLGLAGGGRAARGARTPHDGPRYRRRARPGQGPDRGGRARRPPAGGGACRPAVDVCDAIRPAGSHQPDAAALSRRDRRGDPRCRACGLPAGQPRRADLSSRRFHGRRRGTADRQDERRGRGCGGGRMSATVDPVRDGPVVAERPMPGAPRSYEFPAVRADRLSNGLSVLVVDLPGRPLVSASLTVSGGVSEEPADKAGATVLAARALTEGTEAHDAIALVEATERLGASLHADAGWDAVSVMVDVPAERLAPALELVAEVLLRPTFPDHEVARLRDERLNDLLQARADPRRRVEEAFVGTIYAGASPYHRPSGGTRDTVEGVTAGDLRRTYSGLLDPRRATLVVGGDLGDQDVIALAERLFDVWTANGSGSAAGAP